ncbi:spermidine synthase [Janibacter alittae]|uniref:Spermidine synthase n=1 Tax=Janibacter alittae TaxID=3115209 RepID=A0ABZ2MFC6_9MICO
MDSTPETIATAETPRGEIALRERASADGTVVHELVVAGVFAMDSADTATETALAQRSLERVAAPTRVLVGGLGLGFTAWQALKDRRVRDLHVVEIEEDLVQWARLGLTPTLGVLARHPRVTLHVQDAASAVGDGEPAGPWDLVLLDVDNGPGFLVHEENERLYSATALSVLLSQVTTGGVLAIWAAQREPQLLATLTGLAPTEEIVLPVERQDRCLEYVLYLARA